MAQTPTPAEKVANTIAKKMADSLSLTDGQRQGIYNLNMQLHSQKMEVRNHYAAYDSLRIYMQRIENTRDSLYHTVLNETQYQLYLQKKTNIVNNK